MRLMLAVLLWVGFGVCGVLQAAQDLRGFARVHDGDTIRIGETRVRIWGIDAVELKQICGQGAARVACGKQARAMLESIIARHEVTCAAKGRSYNRVVAVCRVNGVDIGREMVRRGMAFDAVAYSRGHYSADETAARGARAGLWAMPVEEPSHWRACNLPQRRAKRPADCGA